MIDFLMIEPCPGKRGSVVEIYPKFVIKRSNDLMIRGGDFYAIWVEDRGLWSTDEQDALDLIDRELDIFAADYRDKHPEANVKVMYMWDSANGMIVRWHNYCKQHLRDSYHMLDEKLIFSNSETNKKDYASKRLSYPLEPCDIPAYDKLISTLYTEEERQKIEWAIGAIVSGDAKKIQKFMVLYGAAGTGKSTILNIIQQLFEGYYSVFDAKALGSASNSFALEPFKCNPLVAIQHDGDLSKIEDNTQLNSLVSHEQMTVNEKFKSTYTNRFKCFLFMGTNRPVKITDAKSGLIRRLIDVTPSGKKVNSKEYKTLTKQVAFELGGIACHCQDVYLSDPGMYDDYIPLAMMGASNDFYNFVIDSYHVFVREDGVTLKAAWEMYQTYCAEAKVPYPFSQRNFKEELKNYFWEFSDRFNLEDGSRVRSYYSGFRTDRFENQTHGKKKEHKPNLIEFDSIDSVFDKECANYPAQYATSNGIPAKKWDEVKTKLSTLDTSRLHFVKVPENHIVIDFDIPDENGDKCLQRNLEEASKWPPTYAELSKSGQGIHLHYIYTGDPTKLSRVYDDHIEVKVFSGKSSVRRLLTKCNSLPIASISSGLPLKGEDKLINRDAVKSEKGLRVLIKRNLNKEVWPSTKPSVDFIYKILEDAYNQGLNYDVSDMYNAVLAFAANSTNQSDYCLKLVSKMHFKSDEPSMPETNDEAPIVFYDVEVFPNLFLVNWKIQGEGKPVVRMINPTPTEIEDLLQFRLIGFNCRRYDNHMLYACMMGYNNEQLYNLSQKIVNGDRNAFFGEAYNISYTDIYDFAATKQSLKKWEIELGIHHQELGLPWDQPVPKSLWTKVAEYCDNDVIATEAVFDHLKGDWVARQILAGVAGMTVNDTTNSLTTRIIFGNNRKPQDCFNYRNLAEPVGPEKYEDLVRAYGRTDFRIFDTEGQPTYETYKPGMKLPRGYSLLPFFPGYKFEGGKSIYRGIEVGEGGCVIAEPGIHILLALLDVASMHPASVIAETLFGPEFTKRFQEIRDARVAIKHKDFEAARNMLNGALVKYLDDEEAASALAFALKIAINSVYGLTAANFDNPFRDIRNKDNIVAKRGALFMINLMYEVQKRGFTVAHIKTDSIKIPNATPEIIQFVMDYGKEFGYTFEHEATYDRMCLVNDAVYIARYKDGKEAGQWTATGTQFQVPYVFKTLFSKDPILFEDMCETKSVTTALYLDMNEGLKDVSGYEYVMQLRKSSKSPGEFSKKDFAIYTEFKDVPDEVLESMIAEGHDYHFVGKVGRFCPIEEGRGGGVLLREKDGKYSAATGSKGYRWLESEMVKTLGKEDDIDRTYYNTLVDAAVDAISQYGDFEWFVSDHEEETVGEKPDLPPWVMECGRDTCYGCPNFTNTQFDMDCKLGYDISDVVMCSKLNKQ